MPRKKQTDNLIPNTQRTPEELRKMTKKGGIKSGEVRREKKKIKQTFQAVLDQLLEANLPNSAKFEPIREALKVAGFDPETVTFREALVGTGLIRALTTKNGGDRWLKLLCEMSGEVITQKQDVTVTQKEGVKINVNFTDGSHLT